jgi:hypothetical protein
MPITDAELNKPAHAHLLRPASETVFTALRAWRDAPARYEWWRLIIQHGDRQYTAIRFAELRDLLVRQKRSVHMNTALADLPYRRDNPDDAAHPLPGVVSPTVVDGETVSPTRALEMAQASPGQVLIVLQDGKFRGILCVTSRTFAFADKPLLDLLEEFEMGGESETIIVPRTSLSEDTVVDESPDEPRS